MCRDAPDVVTRAAVLDIVPTRHVFEAADRELGLAYYHWFFLAQPLGLPERLIGADPEYYLRWHLRRWSGGGFPFTDEAVAEYLRCFRRPDAIAASCADYRAGASVDLEHDAADRQRQVSCPLLVLWGRHGYVGRAYDVLDVWRECATDVHGAALDASHFLAEERPGETAAALLEFLGS